MQRYRPRSISVLALMVAWMAHRLAAINFIGGLGEPGLPESWAVVFYFDLLIGGTAPFLVRAPRPGSAALNTPCPFE